MIVAHSARSDTAEDGRLVHRWMGLQPYATLMIMCARLSRHSVTCQKKPLLQLVTGPRGGSSAKHRVGIGVHRNDDSRCHMLD